MRKFLFSVTILAGAIAAGADGTALVFTTTDASVHSIDSRNLTISFKDGMMNASNGTQSLTLPLASLTNMYFSDQSSVNEIVIPTDEPIFATSISGIEYGEYPSIEAAKSHLPEGIYIVKTASGLTSKIIVSK